MNIAKKFFIAIILIFFSNLLGYSEEISLSQALDLVKKSNVDIQSTKLQIEIEKNNYKKMVRFYNPSFDMGVNLGTAGKGEPYFLGVSQNLEILKRGIRREIAKINIDLAEDKNKFNEFNMRMNVRQAYIKTVEAKSIYNTIEEQKIFLEDVLKFAKQKSAKNKSNIDEMQVEMAINYLTTELNKARTEVQTQKYNFNKVLNLKNCDIMYDSVDDLLEEKGNFIDLKTPNPNDNLPKYDEIAKNIANKRYDLKIAKQQMEIAKKELILLERERIPDVRFSGGYLYNPKNHSTNKNYEGGAYIGLSLDSLPVFYNYSPEIKNAHINLLQKELYYETLENIIDSDLRTSYEKFLTAKVNLNYYHKNIFYKS